MDIRTIQNIGGDCRVVEIEVSDFCPECGERRGELKEQTLFVKPRSRAVGVTGKTLVFDQISNPCGHISWPHELIAEAEALKEESTHKKGRSVESRPADVKI
ncbi:MAG: hypothetical protein CSB47_10450 [Proteobacteria bacterium]|nr:MAG: hypothetical protein CSB47_10450 [Pseudomonadota bacterium]